ncbi:MAG: hypothetical protein ACOCX0_05455 [Bacteroidota bacterium]
MKIKYKYLVGMIISSVIMITACGPTGDRKTEETTREEEEEESVEVYSAELKSLNSDVTGQEVSGLLTITVEDDMATIDMNVYSLAPNMMHLAHLHGYEDGSAGECAPDADADANGDGIVDLIETREHSGVTMIPFHNNPVNLEISSDSYPVADAQGNLSYSTQVSVEELSAAVEEKFDIEDFSFENFVVYVHGVSAETTLPETVESLPDVPATVTLPVACGKLE